MRSYKPQKKAVQRTYRNEGEEMFKNYFQQLKPPQTERMMMRIKAMMIARKMSLIFMF